MNKRDVAIINVETHFLNIDGHIYAESLMDSLFWSKYLSAFNKLYVIARIKQYDNENLSEWVLSDCEDVVFLPLPDYRGPKEYLKYYFAIKRAIKKYSSELSGKAVAIMRSPSPIGYMFLKQWTNKTNPYGMEICANYSDDFYYHIDVIHSILYGVLNIQTKYYAKKATGVSYVTKKVLQNEYPTDGITASYSSIDIPECLYYKREPLKKRKEMYTLIHVSTLAIDIKGNEEFLGVLLNLRNSGYNATGVVVGGGRLKEYYIKRAADLGLGEFIRFTGHISHKEDLMNELKCADIMLFPTLSEGLPRTVIEAMANSLPCVSSGI